MGEMVTWLSSATGVRELGDVSASGGTRTCTTLVMVYMSLSRFPLLVVFIEVNRVMLEVGENVLGVIRTMVNMVLGITVIALGLRGSMDHAFLRVVAISLKGEMNLWMCLTPLLSRWLDTGTTRVLLTPVSAPLLSLLLTTDADRRTGGHVAYRLRMFSSHD